MSEAQNIQSGELSGLEILNLMGNVVEGYINDYAGGITPLNQTVVSITQYFTGLMFGIDVTWAKQIDDFLNRQSEEAGVVLRKRVEFTLKMQADLEKREGGANG